jgi:hypothetical protein
LLRAVVLSMSACLSWSDVVRDTGIEPVPLVVRALMDQCRLAASGDDGDGTNFMTMKF